jgi:hypothetical protein
MAFVSTFALLPAPAEAYVPIQDCARRKCTPVPDGGSPLPLASASRMTSRAASLVLEARAHELGSWLGSVLVASEIPLRLPRRHRQVKTIDAGRSALVACTAERLLTVVVPGEIRRSGDGAIIVDLTFEDFGATCDRASREIFQHGADWYTVIFRGRRAEIRFTGSFAL